MWWIKVDGKERSLDLAPGTKLTYTMVNPAFEAAQTENSYTYSFQAPISPTNSEITGWAFRMDRFDINYTKEWPATLYVEGLPYKYGVLKLVSHSESTFECEFVIPGRKLLDKLALVELTSLSEAVRYEQYNDFEEGKGYQYGYVDFANDDNFGDDVWFEIVIRGVTYTSPKWAKGLWNGWDGPTKNTKLQEFAEQINTELGLEIATTIGDGFQRIVIRDTVIEITDDEVSPSVLFTYWAEDGTRSLLRKQEMFMHHSQLDVLNNDEKNYCFPMVLATGSAVGENEGAKKYFNLVSGYTYWFHLPQLAEGHTKFKTGQYVPMPKVRWILLTLFEKVGINSILGDAINNVDIQSTILFSNVNMARVQNGPFHEFNEDYDIASIVPLIEWDLSWTMPDGNGKDFLITFCEYFGIYWRYVGEAIEFVKKVDQIQAAQEDWTAKCEPFWGREFVSSGAQIIKYKEVEGIPPSFDQLLPHGTDGDIIELPANTLPMIVSEDRLAALTGGGWIWETEFRTWKTPYWIGSAILPGVENGVRKHNTVPGFVFLFWRGAQPDTVGDSYGLANHDTTNLQGDQVGTLDLDMNAEDYSIYDLRWKDIFEQKNTHKITINVRLGMQDLIRMEKWTNTVKKVYTQLGTILGVVMSVEAQFTSDIWQNEVVCKVEMGVLR